MRIRPGGVELLRAARVVLDATIAPQLGDGHRAALGAIERAITLAEMRLTRGLEASAADLAALENARVAMRGEVFEALHESCRYDARLVAKAIAVAAKELANGHVSERREYERLAALLGVETFARASPREIRCLLPSLNERLVARIRAGEADVGTTTYATTLRHLEAITREALSESNPTYRRRTAEAEPPAFCATPSSDQQSPVDASFAAWSDVARLLLRALPLEAPSGASFARRMGVWLDLRCALGEAVYASGNAALATQADLFGSVTQRVAANSLVPMVAVEGAHLAHDFSIAFADASAALLQLAFLPFRRAKPRLPSVARPPE